MVRGGSNGLFVVSGGLLRLWEWIDCLHLFGRLSRGALWNNRRHDSI